MNRTIRSFFLLNSPLRRRVIGWLLIVYLLWQPLTVGGVWAQAAAGVECLLYLAFALLWPLDRVSRPLRLAVTVLAVVATVCFSLVFGRGAVEIGPLFFVVGFAGARQRGKDSLIVLALAVAAFVWIFMALHPFGPGGAGTALGYTVGLLGTYVGTFSIGKARQSRMLQATYIQQLETAHESLQRAHAALREASVHSLQVAVLEERNRIARDIHDGVGHALTSMIVQLQALRPRIAKDPQAATLQVEQLVAVARRSLQQVRTSVREIADAEPVSSSSAMAALTHSVQNSSGLAIQFTAPPADDWPTPVGVALYHILQEALTNVVRHAAASRVCVHLASVIDNNGRAVRLRVEDDGQASDTAPPAEGFGMRGMRDRCEEAGGTFHWQVRSPHGLLIEATLPAPTPAPVADADRPAPPPPSGGRSDPAATVAQQPPTRTEVPCVHV